MTHAARAINNEVRERLYALLPKLGKDDLFQQVLGRERAVFGPPFLFESNPQHGPQQAGDNQGRDEERGREGRQLARPYRWASGGGRQHTAPAAGSKASDQESNAAMTISTRMVATMAATMPEHGYMRIACFVGTLFRRRCGRGGRPDHGRPFCWWPGQV